MSDNLDVKFFSPKEAHFCESIDIIFLPEDPIFAGHYPNYPVYPASYFIDICVNNIESFFCKLFDPFKKLYLSKSNFYKGIRPRDSVKIEFFPNFNNNFIDFVSVIANVGDEVIAKLVFKFIDKKEKIKKSVSHDYRESELSPAIDYLPQRYPLLVVDLIESAAVGDTCNAIKYVSYADYCYRSTNTFEVPKKLMAYPNGAVIEGIEQSAAVLLSRYWPVMDESKVIVVGGIDGISFYDNAYPGDVIQFSSEKVYLSDGNAILSGVAMVGKKMLMEIEKIFVLVK